MTLKQDSSDFVKVKILGDFTRIEAVLEVLKNNFEVLKSTPIYQNDREPGYHTYLTIKEANNVG